MSSDWIDDEAQRRAGMAVTPLTQAQCTMRCRSADIQARPSNTALSAGQRQPDALEIADDSAHLQRHDGRGRVLLRLLSARQGCRVTTASRATEGARGLGVGGNAVLALRPSSVNRVCPMFSAIAFCGRSY